MEKFNILRQGPERDWEKVGQIFMCPQCGQDYTDKNGIIGSMRYGVNGIGRDLDVGISISDKPTHPLCLHCTRVKERESR